MITQVCVKRLLADTRERRGMRLAQHKFCLRITTSTSCNASARAINPDSFLSLTTAAVGTGHGFKRDGTTRTWFLRHGAEGMILAGRQKNGLTSRDGWISGRRRAVTRF